MSVSRGEFLKALGKSLPGMILNSGAAGAAHKLLTKMAAASGATPSLPAAANMAPLDTTAAPRAEMINRGPIEENHVAITFDDGPHAGNTPRLLDVLKERGVRATFFMIGKHIAAEPNLARRVSYEGHDIGNHTYTHPKLPTLANTAVEEEIRQAADEIGSVLNLRTGWFRPPFGELRRDQFEIVEKYGMKPVLGDVSTKDWSFPGEDHILKSFADATAGSIIICHDFCTQTSDCLGRAIDELLHRGLQPVTLSEMFAKR
jgi:peptidoglycan/xylan/chitin deacetylase (PgdA/CDA1 family)